MKQKEGRYRIPLKKFLYIAAVLLGLIAGACSRQKEREEPSTISSKSAEQKKTPPSSREEAAESERKRTDEFIDEIGIIEAYTPELFVHLTILYKKETARWVAESSALSDAEQQNYIDEENKRFFERFGTTEEEYIRYSTEHWEELDRYIEEHPEFVQALREE
ncbi:MAG: hypothetical protein JXQ30_03070 [Spirochaetes bacterium]|nr:hypothetical protein [Spirochaetota bacterium]